MLLYKNIIMRFEPLRGAKMADLIGWVALTDEFLASQHRQLYR